MTTFLGTIDKNWILFFLPNIPNWANKVSKFDVPVISSIIFDFSFFNLSNFLLIILYCDFKLFNPFFFWIRPFNSELTLTDSKYLGITKKIINKIEIPEDIKTGINVAAFSGVIKFFFKL